VLAVNKGSLAQREEFTSADKYSPEQVLKSSQGLLPKCTEQKRQFTSPDWRVCASGVPAAGAARDGSTCEALRKMLILFFLYCFFELLLFALDQVLSSKKSMSRDMALSWRMQRFFKEVQ